MLDTTAISTALPKMAHDFESNVVQLSAGITSYTVMLAVFIPISGWIADRYGAKKFSIWQLWDSYFLQSHVD
ncbi:MFS transporter [Sphingobacterium sp. E70]|nr:MFS transporter [Sphingobacterium sp. E70]ULT25109.1 MFS transporter [Sphingobacterium sp. E70]